MPKFYYGIINGKKGTGIFHGDWSQVGPLVIGEKGAQQTRKGKDYEAAKSNFEAETGKTVKGYYDYDKDKGKFEWIAVSYTEEDSSDEEADTSPTANELAALKSCTNEEQFISLSNELLSNYDISKLFNENDETLIHWAAEKGFCGAIKMLLEAEMDINLQDKWGETSLHKAVKRGQCEAVKCLLENGAKKSIRKNGAGKELPIEMSRDLNPRLRKEMTEQFNSIHTGYFKVKFEEDTISEIRFKKRYSSTIVVGKLQERQPDLCDRSTAASSGFKLKEGYQVCHKKSDYTIRTEIQAELVGQKYEDVINHLREKGIRYSGSDDRLEAVNLIFEYYKSISTDPENLFIDLRDRNGAFGFLSSIIEQYDNDKSSGKKIFDIADAHYPYLRELKPLIPYISYYSGRYKLTIIPNNVDIIREMADSHYEVFLEQNKIAEAKKQPTNTSSKPNFSSQSNQKPMQETQVFSGHYNNSGASTYFKRKTVEENAPSSINNNNAGPIVKRNKY